MGDPTITLQALQRPSAKLHNIDDKQSYRYHDLLVRQKHEKEKGRFERKPQTCRKALTNLITLCYIDYTSPEQDLNSH
jgi:hypothetical protein